jgi:hypothetical protein
MISFLCKKLFFSLSNDFCFRFHYNKKDAVAQSFSDKNIKKDSEIIAVFLL